LRACTAHRHCQKRRGRMGMKVRRARTATTAKRARRESLQAGNC
jgi:hypothetical protein